jgi:DNA processing protein
VEAEEVSGTSITANLALEQGKELFAVPGNITSPTSVGTNRLIKSGAVPVTCSDDVLEQFNGYDIKEYAPLPETPETPVAEELADDDAPEKLILDAVRTDALTPDEISLKTGLSLAEITGVLTIMEIAGLVEMAPGHKYIKTSKLK